MPDNPRIPVPPTANPVYLTNAFLQAPGGHFWESPGKVRRSGAIPAQMLYCMVHAVKPVPGINPLADAGYPFYKRDGATLVDGLPADPNQQFYFQYHKRFQRQRVTAIRLGVPAWETESSLDFIGLPTTGSSWPASEYNNQPDPSAGLDNRWMRRGNLPEVQPGLTYAVDAYGHYEWQNIWDGTGERGIFLDESDPNDSYVPATAYAKGYDLGLLPFAATTGRRYFTTSYDFVPRCGYLNPTGEYPNFRYAGYTEGWASYLTRFNGEFGQVDSINANVPTSSAATGPQSVVEMLGWTYDYAAWSYPINPFTTPYPQISTGTTSAIAAFRSKIRLPAAATDGRRILFIDQEQPHVGAAIRREVGSIFLEPGQEYSLSPQQMPPFDQWLSHHIIYATFG